MPPTKVRYTYRLRPGKRAEAALVEEWGRCRWVWNQCQVAGGQAGAGRGRFLEDADLTAARAKLVWLAAGAQNPQQQVMRQYRARKGRGHSGRKLKKKHTLPSINYTRNGFSIRDTRLRLAGGISVPVVWSRQLPAEPSSVRVYRDPLGHWYASFVVEVVDEPLAPVNRAVGIDWGVATVAMADTPEFDLETPEHGRKAAARLAGYQRRMARRKPAPGQAASNGYREAKQHTARTHKKIARQRQHTARMWAKRVVAGNDEIAVENFRPKFLAKTKMARKAADNAIAATKTELISRAERAGRKVVLVPPAYTTMTCHKCGTRAKDRLRLSQRVFVCESCGLIEHRDRNAAKTILAMAGFNHAGADVVRPSSQAPRLGLRAN